MLGVERSVGPGGPVGGVGGDNVGPEVGPAQSLSLPESSAESVLRAEPETSFPQASAGCGL